MTDLERRDSSGKISLERTLGQRMHAFSNTISGYYYRRTEVAIGVNLAEWRVLRSVVLNPGTTQGEISMSEGLNVMNVSRALASLRKKGLVEANPDPADRRRALLTGTELGHELSDDIAPREETVYREVFSELSLDERKVLNELLGRITDRLNTLELPEPASPSRNWASLLKDHRASK